MWLTNRRIGLDPIERFIFKTDSIGGWWYLKKLLPGALVLLISNVVTGIGLVDKLYLVFVWTVLGIVLFMSIAETKARRSVDS